MEGIAQVLSYYEINIHFVSLSLWQIQRKNPELFERHQRCKDKIIRMVNKFSHCLSVPFLQYPLSWLKLCPQAPICFLPVSLHRVTKNKLV